MARLPPWNPRGGQASLFTFHRLPIYSFHRHFSISLLANGGLLPYFSIVKNPLTLAILILFLACERESTYVPTEKERRVLNAYTVLSILNSSFAATASPDSIRIYKTKVDSILQHEGLSRDEFRTEMETLALSPERFQRLFLEIHNRLQKETSGGK